MPPTTNDPSFREGIAEAWRVYYEDPAVVEAERVWAEGIAPITAMVDELYEKQKAEREEMNKRVKEMKQPLLDAFDQAVAEALSKRLAAIDAVWAEHEFIA